jgi:hypothetical protein
MDGLVQDIFVKARDSYHSAVRWAFLVVVSLALLHLCLFNQVLQVERGLRDTQANLGRLSAGQERLADVNARLDALSGLAAVDTLVKDWRQGLIERFAALDVAARPLVQGGAVSPLRPGEGGRGAGTDISDMVSQSAPRTQAGASTRPGVVLDGETRRKLDNVSNVEQYRAALLDYIKAHVIDEEYARLNERWKARAADIVARADEVTQAAHKGRGESPGYEAAWDAIAAGADNVAARAKELRFEKPAGNEWWMSVSGKTQVGREHAEAAGQKLGAAAEASRAAKQMGAELAAAKEEQARLNKSLKDRLAALDEQFKKQQAKIAGGGQALTFLALDVEFLARRFPLLLGLMLGVAIFWPTFRRSELERAGALLASVAAESDVGGRVMQFDLASEPRPAVSTLVPCALALAWVGVATFSLAASGAVSHGVAAALGAAGALFVLAATGYRAVALGMVSRGSGGRLSGASFQRAEGVTAPNAPAPPRP